MGAERIRERLDAAGVDYRVHAHPRAVTAQEVAAAEHESGWHVAKPVLVVADGQLAMVVVPAAMYVDLEATREALGASVVRLADEPEFSARVPRL